MRERLIGEMCLQLRHFEEAGIYPQGFVIPAKAGIHLETKDGPSPARG
jgi:hypothetical protein